jgi:predicted cupin superfamily sugar epimerase
MGLDGPAFWSEAVSEGAHPDPWNLSRGERLVTPAELIERLGLEPHPEGGWYRQTWLDAVEDGQRGSGSAVYYLLTDADVSLRHRVDATEIWHYYSGAPIELRIGTSGGPDEVHILGPDIDQGQAPQILVPQREWQQARSLGPYTLVGCTVSPAFQFSGFELAEPTQSTGLPRARQQ